MGFGETVLLGAIAGFTIYIGLPAGRVQRLDQRLRVALAMLSVGILAFIFVDVSAHAQQIVEGALNDFKDHRASFGHVAGLFGLLALGFVVGTAGIATVERRLRRSRPPAPMVGGDATAEIGEGALADHQAAVRQAAMATGMSVAVAIGLHNFAEGLAIGVSAKTGAIGLATVLVIGFSLHNATEGFGIVGPLGTIRPSWAWLGLAGLIGGGPTLVGAIVGYQVHSDPLELCFYALAGGAILYVIGEIWHGVRRYGHRELGLLLLSAGFAAGLLTDLVVAYGSG